VSARRRARLVHLPVHASWRDRIAIYCSIVQRKPVTPNDLTDLDALLDRIATHELDSPLPMAV